MDGQPDLMVELDLEIKTSKFEKVEFEKSKIRKSNIENQPRLPVHVVLFHGGGITGFTQVNDTHLHALLQRLLIMLENRTALVGVVGLVA